MSTHRTKRYGFGYSKAQMVKLRRLMPNAVARGESREFFERNLEKIVMAYRFDHATNPRWQMVDNELIDAALAELAELDEPILEW